MSVLVNVCNFIKSYANGGFFLMTGLDKVLYERYPDHVCTYGSYGVHLECSDVDLDKVDPGRVRDCVARDLQGRNHYYAL